MNTSSLLAIATSKLAIYPGDKIHLTVTQQFTLSEITSGQDNYIILEILSSIDYILHVRYSLLSSIGLIVNVYLYPQIFWCVKGTQFRSPLNQHSEKKVNQLMKFYFITLSKCTYIKHL